MLTFDLGFFHEAYKNDSAPLRGSFELEQPHWYVAPRLVGLGFVRVMVRGSMGLGLDRRLRVRGSTSLGLMVRLRLRALQRGAWFEATLSL